MRLKSFNFWEVTSGNVLGLTTQYLIYCGIAWVLGYWLFKRAWFHRKIISRFPRSRDIWRDIGLSVSSILIFSVVAGLTYLAAKKGWTQIYWKRAEHSQVWFWTSIVCTIFLHDAWFYWTHRLMHHKKLFKWFHKAHHLSHNPTPWTAYAMDPLEALVNAMIFPLAALTLPLHLHAFSLFMVWQIVFNVAGHAGYEFYPRWSLRTPLGWILNTPTNHVMHHEKLRGNYGLYFNLWDRLMGTNHAEYEKRFTEITSGNKRATTTTPPSSAPAATP